MNGTLTNICAPNTNTNTLTSIWAPTQIQIEYDDFDDDEVVNDADDNRSERFLQQSSHSDQGGNWSRLLVIIGRMN